MSSGAKLNGGWARQIEDSRNGGGGAGCSFQEKGLTRVKQSLTAEESDGVGGGGRGRRKKGWTERNVITQSRSLGVRSLNYTEMWTACQCGGLSQSCGAAAHSPH